MNASHKKIPHATKTRTASGGIKNAPPEVHCKAIVGDWRRAKSIGDSFCKNEPLDNGYCKLHQFITKPKQEMTRGETQVVEKYRKIGEQKKVTPAEALATLISESAGNVEYLRNEVRKLEKLVVVGRKTREEISGLMQLYNEERDRHEKYVTDGIRIRLEERQQEIDLAQAKVLAAILKTIVDRIGLKGDQRREALKVGAEQLRLAGAAELIGWDGPLQDAIRDQNIIDVNAVTLDVPASEIRVGRGYIRDPGTPIERTSAAG